MSKRGNEARPRLLSNESNSCFRVIFAGPWRTKGDWWSETEWARDEWEFEMRTLRPRFQAERTKECDEETALYRVYKDLRTKRWFVEGIYD